MARLLTAGRARLADEAGMGIIVAVVLTFVVLGLGAVWMAIGTHGVSASGRETLRERARTSAEAGLSFAMGQLTADAGWVGSVTCTSESVCGPNLTAVPGAQFEVTVTTPAGDATDPRRLITAVGYAPAKDHARRVGRRLAQEVVLRPADGFRHALFAAPGGVTGMNSVTIDGDVYSNGNLELNNSTRITGDVISPGSVTMRNGISITGTLHAGGAVTLQNNSTVNGDVISGGDVTLTNSALIKGNATAAGSITGNTVQGSRNPSASPPPPVGEALPSFSWNAANYPGSSTWASPAEFRTHWQANRNAFGGVHRVLCPVPCTSVVALDADTTVTGDVTIVSDAPVEMSRKIVSPSGQTVNLVVVSLATDGDQQAIEMHNNTMLENVRVLLYAPNGSALFRNSQTLSGAVYARSIQATNNFSVRHLPISAPGFGWSFATSRHYTIQAGPFRELAS